MGRLSDARLCGDRLDGEVGAGQEMLDTTHAEGLQFIARAASESEFHPPFERAPRAMEALHEVTHGDSFGKMLAEEADRARTALEGARGRAAQDVALAASVKIPLGSQWVGEARGGCLPLDYVCMYAAAA